MFQKLHITGKHTKMNYKLLVLLFVSIFSINTFASEKETKADAKSTTVSVSGTVMDETTGELLTGVTVALEGTNQKTYTDFEGNFSFENVKEGTYNVKVELVSYKEVELKNVAVSNQNQDLTVKLGQDK